MEEEAKPKPKRVTKEKRSNRWLKRREINSLSFPDAPPKNYRQPKGTKKTHRLNFTGLYLITGSRAASLLQVERRRLT